MIFGEKLAISVMNVSQCSKKKSGVIVEIIIKKINKYQRTLYWITYMYTSESFMRCARRVKLTRRFIVCAFFLPWPCRSAGGRYIFYLKIWVLLQKYNVHVSQVIFFSFSILFMSFLRCARRIFFIFFAAGNCFQQRRQRQRQRWGEQRYSSI